MQLIYKYRAYPNKSQQRSIARQLEICRIVYNRALTRKNEAWTESKTSLSCYDLNKELTLWKKTTSELNIVHSQVLQSVVERVDLAFKGFFRRLKLAKPGEALGFPKEKEAGRLRSMTYPQSGFKLLSESVALSKIGKIKTRFHRALPAGAVVKRLSLVKYPSGKYFICLTLELSTPVGQPTKSPKAVGIDLGITHFAVLSDGQVFESPKAMRKAKRAIARRQRNEKRVALAHERVANQRSDFLHKLANKLVSQYDIIAVEDLDINRMRERKRTFSKDFRSAIADMGWSTFINMLCYKAVIAGKQVVLVDPAFTSQDCSRCGARQKLALSERVFHCPRCSLHICRDANAALNILRLGMQSLGENP